jgi:hypothetical protein
LLLGFVIIWLAIGTLAAFRELRRHDRVSPSDLLMSGFLLLGGPLGFAFHALLYLRR